MLISNGSLSLRFVVDVCGFMILLSYSLCFPGGWIRVNLKIMLLQLLTSQQLFLLYCPLPAHLPPLTFTETRTTPTNHLPSFGGGMSLLPPSRHPTNSFLYLMALQMSSPPGCLPSCSDPRWGPWFPFLPSEHAEYAFYYHTHHITCFPPCLLYCIVSILKQELCSFLLYPWCLFCAPAQSRHLGKGHLAHLHFYWIC